MWTRTTPKRDRFVRDFNRKRNDALLEPLFPAPPNADETSRVSILLALGPHAHEVRQVAAHEFEAQAHDIEILECNVHTLVQRQQDSTYTAEQIVSAFIRSARRAQVATNAITQPLFSPALERARALDSHLKSTGQPVGPLHGVPFSVKDQILVSGARSTVGYIEWARSDPAWPKLQPSNPHEQAALVQAFIALGAIPLCKTNVPQTMLTFHSANPLYGTTTNPYSKDHIAGGSSSGEGALLACDGAAFGIGTDIGGSIRIPAGLNGIFGFKPSSGRLPMTGIVSASLGQEGVKSTVGPLTRSMADLIYLYRLIIGYIHPQPGGSVSSVEAQDAIGSEPLAAQPLREELLRAAPKAIDPLQPTVNDEPSPVVEQRTLRVGFYAFDGITKPSPPVERAMSIVVERLATKYGDPSGNEPTRIELVPVPPTLVSSLEGFSIFSGILTTDQGRGVTHPICNDPMEAAVKSTLLLAKLPWIVRTIVRFFLRTVIGDGFLSQALTYSGSKSGAAYWAVVGRRIKFARTFNDRVWKGLNLDALITPVQASPAVPADRVHTLTALAISTALFNLLDCPSVVVPVTRVDPTLDSAVAPSRNASVAQVQRYNQWVGGYPALGNATQSSRIMSLLLYGRQAYNAQAMAGLPVGVQVVGRQHNDETALAVAGLLTEALDLSSFGPGAYIAKTTC